MIIRSNNALTRQTSNQKPVYVEENKVVVKKEVKKPSSKKRVKPVVNFEEEIIPMVEETVLEENEKENDIEE